MKINLFITKNVKKSTHNAVFQCASLNFFIHIYSPKKKWFLSIFAHLWYTVPLHANTLELWTVTHYKENHISGFLWQTFWMNLLKAECAFKICELASCKRTVIYCTNTLATLWNCDPLKRETYFFDFLWQTFWMILKAECVLKTSQLQSYNRR